MKTSFKTGPEGTKKVFLIVSLKLSKSLILTIKPPKESIVTIDEKTGKKTPVSKNPKIIIRDNDLDGMLDDFKIEPGRPPTNAMLTKDGFMSYTGNQEERAIFVQWMVGIGYCINHFLHGVNSAFPIR